MAEQGGFRFDAPNADVQTTTPVGDPLPPFQGREPRSRHTSLDGALVGQAKAGSQKARMLVRYLHAGAQTDGEMALALGLPDGRISARRSGLIEAGLVESQEIVIGPYGAKNVKWTLTVKGLHVASQIAEIAR